MEGNPFQRFNIFDGLLKIAYLNSTVDTANLSSTVDTAKLDSR